MSIATVSNVLNKPGRTSAHTTARVQQAMEELGYVPNQLARDLRTGTPTSLGMILLSVANPFFADLAHAAELAAEAAGFHLTFGSSNESVEREARYLELFARQRVAGVLIAPVDGHTSGMEELQRRGTPVVLFDDLLPSGALSSVVVDGRAGGELAARHLIERGRKNLAFIGGPLPLVEQRWIGAMQAAAAEADVRLRHIDTFDTTIGAGIAAAEAILSLPVSERPDGVFAANDLIALGLQQTLLASGQIRLPQDMAMVGYDDIAFATTATVPLTTVRQPVEKLAEAAVALLTGEREGVAPQRMLLQPELIVRASSG